MSIDEIHQKSCEKSIEPSPSILQLIVFELFTVQLVLSKSNSYRIQNNMHNLIVFAPNF